MSSGAQTALSSGHDVEKAARRRPWVDQVTLARPRRCGAKAWLERQSKMGARASARVAKAKGGLASSFGHDHKGIRRFEVAHVEAVLHGLRMEEMADGPAVRVGLGQYCRTGLGPRPN
jgi:hypothetical protein